MKQLKMVSSSGQFQCMQCGNCCRGEGLVSATEDEVREMADYLHLDSEDFKNRYITPALFPHYWLAERQNKDCIFLENNRCLVHPVKPSQCKSFPQSWLNEDSRNICPALKNGSS